MSTFVCDRCHHSAGTKANLIRHLSKQKTCAATYSQMEPKSIIASLTVNTSVGPNTCKHCSRHFNNKSSMYRHLKVCKHRPVVLSGDILSEKVQEIEAMVLQMYNDTIIEKTKQDSKQLKRDNTKLHALELELQYYKNRKNEAFYQLVLEEYLGGGHKKLSCGITDVTTDDKHAEIKVWNEWKYGIGQLVCYNTRDPKESLELYMFGKYEDSCKKEAVNVATENSIKVFEFVHNDNIVDIVDMTDGITVYQYVPDK